MKHQASYTKQLAADGRTDRRARRPDSIYMTVSNKFSLKLGPEAGLLNESSSLAAA